MEGKQSAMPICFKCSAENPDGSARCGKCGALFPRMMGPADETSRLYSMEEGRVYPAPTETFETENIMQLRAALENYLEDPSSDGEDVKHWLGVLREGFQEFSAVGVAGLNRALEVEKNLNNLGDFHHEIGYLVHKGLLMCESGLTRMETAFAAENEEELPTAFDEFRIGNDHICTALLKIEDRKDMLEEILERTAPIEAE